MGSQPPHFSKVCEIFVLPNWRSLKGRIGSNKCRPVSLSYKGVYTSAEECELTSYYSLLVQRLSTNGLLSINRTSNLSELIRTLSLWLERGLINN